MKEQFNTFLTQLYKANLTLSDLSDFEKVYLYIQEIKPKLLVLNRLLDCSNIYDEIKVIWDKTPEVFDIMHLLVATRENKTILNRKQENIKIKEYSSSYENICEFIIETGLLDLFQSAIIHNLVDYVFGVEVGLNANARKNKGGTIMERYISTELHNNSIEFHTQISSSAFPEITTLEIDLKRFDFVVQTAEKTYLIEANFYNTHGSKLNETARAYTEIASKINCYPNYEFVWITDGNGWNSAKNKLEEAYRSIPHMYNLTTLNEFIKILKN